MTIEPYNYNDEPSGRTDTLIQALDKIERLEKQLEVAKDLLEKCLVHLSAGYLGTDEIPVNVLIDQINQFNNN